jgi:hypothetical protein
VIAPLIEACGLTLATQAAPIAAFREAGLISEGQRMGKPARIRSVYGRIPGISGPPTPSAGVIGALAMGVQVEAFGFGFGLGADAHEELHDFHDHQGDAG